MDALLDHQPANFDDLPDKLTKTTDRAIRIPCDVFE